MLSIVHVHLCVARGVRKVSDKSTELLGLKAIADLHISTA